MSIRKRSVLGNLIPTNLWRKGSFLVVLTVAAALPAFAQHPYLWLDMTEIGFMRNKVTANSSDWQALEAQCDVISQYAVQWPHATAGGSSRTRGYVYNPKGAANSIYQGYYGGGWDSAIDQLGACYQAIRTTDSNRAATYLAQAHNIITAMAQPWIKLVRSSDGLVRYGVSTDSNGNDLLAGAQVQVLLTNNTGTTGPSVGETWTLSGATGCTSMNGTFKVSTKSGIWTVLFTQTNGSNATLNANCTLYSVSIVDGYPVRFYMPAIAKAYDWFLGDAIYGGLSESYPDDVRNLAAAMTAWATELGYINQFTHPENNYHAGFLWGAVACYVAFDTDHGSDIAAPCNNIIAREFSAPHQTRDYNSLWLAGGGDGEGLQAYGFGSIRRILNAELAMKIHGIDWSAPPYYFTFLDDNLQYFMEFTTPSKTALDDNEYVYPVGAAYVPGGQYTGQWFPTELVYIPLDDTAMYTAIARKFNSRYAANFQNWYDDVYAAEYSAAGVQVPEWSSGIYQSQPTAADYFLWYNPEAASSDWTRLPLMYRAWGGDYAVTRTDWSGTATEVTLLGGPSVGTAGNGKTQFDSGAISIQTGNNRLLVYGLGEAARAADIISATEHNILHNERATYGNKKNSIFWAGSNAAETHNQGLTSPTPPPGQVNTVTTWPSTIDRAEDQAAYTYFRAIHLEANNAKSGIDGKYHQVSWTRELLFLRPKLVIVHDRTAVLDNNDDRALFWTFGRDIAQVSAGVPAGMTRYDASFQGVYRGAFWSVLPSAAEVKIVDHDDLHFLYRAEVRPSAQNHTADNWLAVFDAAASSGEVNAVNPVTATNADAVQFNDVNASIVAFANIDPHLTAGTTLSWATNGSRMQYVVGLTPRAGYAISTLNGRFTVSSGGAYLASAAGVLVYGRALTEGSPIAPKSKMLRSLVDQY